MSTVRKFSYRSDLDELGRICDDVAVYCREHQIDPDTALALTLCLDELFTNTIKYGYTAASASKSTAASDTSAETPASHPPANETPHTEEPASQEASPAAPSQPNGHCPFADLLVEVHLERHENRVQVHYRDKGHPFNPFSNQPPLPDMSRVCPERLPTGGFGIHLLRKLSSEARYTREGEHNTISLTFSWR